MNSLHAKRSAIVLVALLLAGCAVRQPDVSTATPAQKVAVYNAALAKANLAVASGAIELQKSKALTVAQTRAVLNYNELVANASEAIRVIQSGATPWPDAAIQINKILDSVNMQKWLASSGADIPQVRDLLGAIASTLALISQEVKP